MEITKEIKCKVFAQYLGRDLKTQTGTVQLVGIHVDNFNRVFDAVVLNGNVTHTSETENVKLILKPLSAITDEDAIVIHKIAQSQFLTVLQAKEYIDDYATKSTCYQYLQSKGYDLPNYLLNGKTLKEVDLAIYE
jgi:hypothetical protein